MSNPNHPVGGEVDPSEGSIDEGDEQQGLQEDDSEDENPAAPKVDPSEKPAQ